MKRLFLIAMCSLWFIPSTHAFQDWQKKSVLKVAKNQNGFSVRADEKIQSGDELVFFEGSKIVGLAQIEKCATKICIVRIKKLSKNTSIKPKQSVYARWGDRRRFQFNLENTFTSGYEFGISQKILNAWYLGIQAGHISGRRFRTGIEGYELSGQAQFVVYEKSRFEFLLSSELGVQHFNLDFAEIVSREKKQRVNALFGELGGVMNWRVTEKIYLNGSLGYGYNTLPSKVEGKFSDYAIDFIGVYSIVAFGAGITF